MEGKELPGLLHSVEVLMKFCPLAEGICQRDHLSGGQFLNHAAVLIDAIGHADDCVLEASEFPLHLHIADADLYRAGGFHELLRMSQSSLVQARDFVGRKAEEVQLIAVEADGAILAAFVARGGDRRRKSML